MKRILVLIMLLIISLLGACASNGHEGDVSIEQKIDDKIDVEILDVLTDQFGLWDVTIHHKEATDIEIVIDHYEHGEKQEPIMQMSTMIDKENKSNNVTVLVAEQTYDDEAKWTTAFIDDGGSSSSETFAPSLEEFTSMAYSTVSVPDTFPIGKPFVIGTMVLSSTEDSITPSVVFEENFSPEAIEAYDHTYIVSLQVK